MSGRRKKARLLFGDELPLQWWSGITLRWNPRKRKTVAFIANKFRFAETTVWSSFVERCAGSKVICGSVFGTISDVSLN